MTRNRSIQIEKPPPGKPFDSEPYYVWLTPRRMVARYAKSTMYWYLRRKDETGPPFHPIGSRSLLYRMDLVEVWMEEHRVTGFDDPKYQALAEERRAARSKARKSSPSRIGKAKECAFPVGTSVFRPGTSIQATSRPRVFRFRPSVSACPLRFSALDCAQMRLPFRRAV